MGTLQLRLSNSLVLFNKMYQLSSALICLTGTMAFPQIPLPLGFGHHAPMHAVHAAAHLQVAAHPLHVAHPAVVASHLGHVVAAVPHPLAPAHAIHHAAVPAVVNHHTQHHVDHDGSVHSVHTKEVHVLPHQH